MGPMGPLGSTMGWINNQKWPPLGLLDAVPLIIQPTQSRAAAKRDLNAPLVGPHSAIQARRSSRVLQAHAWAGRAEHTARFSGFVRCVQMLIMLMGRRLSLSVMRSLNRETALLRSARSLLIPHRAHLLFPAGLLPKACKAPTRQRDRSACSKHRVDGINPGVNPRGFRMH